MQKHTVVTSKMGKKVSRYVPSPQNNGFIVLHRAVGCQKPRDDIKARDSVDLAHQSGGHDGENSGHACPAPDCGDSQNACGRRCDSHRSCGRHTTRRPCTCQSKMPVPLDQLVYLPNVQVLITAMTILVISSHASWKCVSAFVSGLTTVHLRQRMVQES